MPVVGIVASYVFQFNGALNTILRSVGLERLAHRLDRQRALRAVDDDVRDHLARGRLRHRAVPGAHAVASTRSQLEAARIEGAGWFQRLRHVILPELRGAIEFYVVIASITMLAWVFAYVFTLTAGGPGDATTVLELYIYNQGVRNSLPGMASAVAVLLLLVHDAARASSSPCARAACEEATRVTVEARTPRRAGPPALRLRLGRRAPRCSRIFLLVVYPC